MLHIYGDIVISFIQHKDSSVLAMTGRLCCPPPYVQLILVKLLEQGTTVRTISEPDHQLSLKKIKALFFYPSIKGILI